MIHKISILSLLFIQLVQAQIYPPSWSANNWIFSDWVGDSIDSAFTKTYIQDSTATQGLFSQNFSSGGHTQMLYPNLHLFIIFWKKTFPEFNVPLSFKFDFNVKSIDSIKSVYLGFTYGHTYWAVARGITRSFQIGQWETVQVDVTNPIGNVFNYIEFSLGFEDTIPQVMHFEYLIDNLQLVYSDTTILIDDFGDSATNIETPFFELNITQYILKQNYPNPFNPSTVISFSIPENSFVSIKIYDVLGNELSELVNEIKEQGNYSVSFDASNLSSGIYFYTLKANGNSLTKKMLLAK